MIPTKIAARPKGKMEYSRAKNIETVDHKITEKYMKRPINRYETINCERNGQSTSKIRNNDISRTKSDDKIQPKFAPGKITITNTEIAIIHRLVVGKLFPMTSLYRNNVKKAAKKQTVSANRNANKKLIISAEGKNHAKKQNESKMITTKSRLSVPDRQIDEMREIVEELNGLSVAITVQFSRDE